VLCLTTPFITSDDNDILHILDVVLSGDNTLRDIYQDRVPVSKTHKINATLKYTLQAKLQIYRVQFIAPINLSIRGVIKQKMLKYPINFLESRL